VVNVGTLVAVLKLQDLMGPALLRAQKQFATTGKKFEDVGRRLSTTGKKFATRVTLPLVGVGVAALKMASDAEEAGNKFDVVMGPAASRVRAELQRLTSTIPLTRSQMESLSAGTQDMLVPMGLARDKAADMSLEMVKLASDLGSFNNVGTKDVLLAMQSALAGSSEPMRRFGVDTREAALKAIALSAGLIKAGQEMDSTSRAQAVLLAIQKDSTDAMGDAARTADSTANLMKFLARDIRSVGEMIGKILIPVVRPMLAQMKEWLQKLKDADPATKKWAIVIAAVGAAIGPVLIVLGAMATAVGALLPAIGAVIGILSGPVGWIALLGALLLSIKPVRDALKFVASTIKNFVLGQFERFRSAMEEVRKDSIKLIGFLARMAEKVAFLPGPMGASARAFLNLTAKMRENAEVAAPVIDRINKLGGGVKRLAPELPKVAAGLKDDAAATVKLGSALAETVPRVETLVSLYPSWVLGINAVADAQRARLAGQKTISEGLDKFGGQLPGIIDDLGRQAQAEASLVDEHVALIATTSFLSKLFSGFGSSIKAIIAGITGGKGLLGAFNNLGKGIIEGFGQIISGGLSSIIQAALSKIISFIGKALSFIGKLFGKTNAAKEISKQFGLSLSKALTQQIQDLGDTLGRDFGAAFRQSLAAVIEEVGISTAADLQKFLGFTRDIFSDFDRSVITSAQAVSAIGEAILAQLPSFSKFGQDLSVLTGPGGVLSDMINRLKSGQLSAAEVKAQFELIANAARAMGIAGVDALIALAAEAGITLDVMTDAQIALQQARDDWKAWADSVGIQTTTALRHNRAYFENLAKTMGLSASTARAFVEGSLKAQRDAQKTFEQEQRAGFRQQAIDLGLQGDEVREFVRANLKLVRQADRDAKKAARQARRQEVKDFRTVQEDMARIGIHNAQLVGDAWVKAARDAADAWDDTRHSTVGGSSILDIGRIGSAVADSLGERHVAAAVAAQRQWSVSGAAIAAAMSPGGHARLPSPALPISGISPVSTSAPAPVSSAAAGGGGSGAVLDRLARIERAIIASGNDRGRQFRHAMQTGGGRR